MTESISYEPRHRRRSLTPSIGVSILVLITSAILLGLAISLFMATKTLTDVKDYQKTAVLYGCRLLEVLSVAGLVIAVTDFFFRFEFRRDNVVPENPVVSAPPASITPAPSTLATPALLKTEGYATPNPIAPADNPDEPLFTDSKPQPGLVDLPEPPLE